MPVTQLNPYVNLNGTAEKAIALYEQALGAKVEGPIMRFSDMPGIDPGSEHARRVIHAELGIGGGALMVADAMPGHDVHAGDSRHVCLNYDDEREMERAFRALARDGRVTLDLHDAFFGARFGMLTDAFGVSWMFVCRKGG